MGHEACCGAVDRAAVHVSEERALAVIVLEPENDTQRGINCCCFWSKMIQNALVS